MHIVLTPDCIKDRLKYILGVCLGTMIWLWPTTHGPLSAFWPNMVAWGAGILLSYLLGGRINRAARTVTCGWVLAAVISAILALMQYYGLEDRLLPFVSSVDAGNAVANVRQTNQLATFLVSGLAALILLRRHLGILPILARIYAAVLLLGVAATASRTGLLELFLLVFLLISWAKNRHRKVVPIALGILVWYLIASWLLPKFGLLIFDLELRELGSRLKSSEVIHCASRLVLWSNVLDLIALKPWTGWGWGELRFAHYMSDVEGVRYCEPMGNAHNLPLHLAVELGIPVAFIIIFSIGWFVYKNKPWNDVNPYRKTAWCILMLVGLHSMLEYPLWFGNFQVMVVFCLLFLSLSRRDRIVSDAKSKIGLSRGFVVASSLVLVTMVFVSWDYFRVSQLFLPANQRFSLFGIDPLTHARKTLFFSKEVIFAQVITATPDADNAEALLAASIIATKTWPEPRTVEKVLESALLIGNNEVFDQYKERYRISFPQDYERWIKQKM